MYHPALNACDRVTRPAALAPRLIFANSACAYSSVISPLRTLSIKAFRTSKLSATCPFVSAIAQTKLRLIQFVRPNSPTHLPVDSQLLPANSRLLPVNSYLIDI